MLTLSLENSPARDVMAGTLISWCEAITRDRVFDADIDAPRFRAAFATLLQQCRRWPAPADFLAALPPRPRPPRLPRLIDEGAMERGLQQAEQILRQLSGGAAR